MLLFVPSVSPPVFLLDPPAVVDLAKVHPQLLLGGGAVGQEVVAEVEGPGKQTFSCLR